MLPKVLCLGLSSKNRLFISMCTWWLKSLELNFPAVVSGNLNVGVSRSSLEVSELSLLSMGLLLHQKATRVFLPVCLLYSEKVFFTLSSVIYGEKHECAHFTKD